MFWNFLVYWFHFGSATWGLLLPLATPTGVDFRDGLYQPALDFSTAHSGWPPLTLLLGRPFTLFSFSTGYAIQVVVLVALALAAIALSAVLARRALGTSDDAAGRDPPVASRLFGRRVTAAQIAVVAGLWLLTSYGFMYEIERGNIDLYALFFALLAVWLMLKLRAVAVVAGGRRSPSRHQPEAVSRRTSRAALLAVSLEGGGAGGGDERRAAAGRRARQRAGHDHRPVRHPVERAGAVVGQPFSVGAGQRAAPAVRLAQPRSSTCRCCSCRWRSGS